LNYLYNEAKRLNNLKLSNLYMKNFFTRERKKDHVIHQHPIMDDYCHNLNDIKILNNKDLHIHLNLAHGHEHVCFDID